MATEPRSTTIFGASGKQIAAAFWGVLCAFYVFWWGVKHSFAKTVHSISKAALVIAALFFVADAILIVMGYRVLGQLEGGAKWVLVLVALSVFLHRWKEWLTKREGFYFVKGMEPLFDALGRIALVNGGDKVSLIDDFIMRVLVIVHETFKERFLTNVNIMRIGHDGRLRMTHKHPTDIPYESTFSLAPGEGGAGVSFDETAIVYIPSVRYEHGITMKLPEYRGDDIRSAKPPDFGLRPKVYVPPSTRRYEVYSSILSVPITGPGGTVGVLNLDSRKSDPFDDHDAHVANAYARALGVAMSLYPVAAWSATRAK